LRRAGLIAIALLAALATTEVAQGEVEKSGNVIVSFDGGIAPRALPRAGTAPVTVSVEGRFRTTGQGERAQLRTISIGINRDGKIFDRGLPTCKVRRIQPTTIQAAHEICGDAIVGSGHVAVRVHLTGQKTFLFKGPMLVFHAQRSGGQRRLLAQVYGKQPPSAFVLTFKIRQQKGTFGTVIQTKLPESARKWAYVTSFDMKLHRIYEYRGEERSFISAGCAAPEGFPGAVYPFARAKFGFGGGLKVTSTLIRDCKVR